MPTSSQSSRPPGQAPAASVTTPRWWGHSATGAIASQDPSRLSISRKASNPPSEDSRPPSKRATTGLPCIGDRPGRNGVTSTMAGIAPDHRHWAALRLRAAALRPGRPRGFANRQPGVLVWKAEREGTKKMPTTKGWVVIGAVLFFTVVIGCFDRASCALLT
jgi:hypothetical protein